MGPSYDNQMGWRLLGVKSRLDPAPVREPFDPGLLFFTETPKMTKASMGLVQLLTDKLKITKIPPFALEEKRISVEFGQRQVRVKTMGKDMYLEKCLQAAGKLKNVKISRFYLVNEHPWGLHLAPTLEKALDWFIGKKSPNDGYLSISWGKDITHLCDLCGNNKTEPLHVTKVQKVILSGDVPFQYEIEGWRVSEVETKKMGKGTPAKLIGLKTIPIVKWYSRNNLYLCQRCADRLKAIGQEDKLSGHSIF
jgi:hypothetical protein